MNFAERIHDAIVEYKNKNNKYPTIVKLGYQQISFLLAMGMELNDTSTVCGLAIKKDSGDDVLEVE